MPMISQTSCCHSCSSRDFCGMRNRKKVSLACGRCEASGLTRQQIANTSTSCSMHYFLLQQQVVFNSILGLLLAACLKRASPHLKRSASQR